MSKTFRKRQYAKSLGVKVKYVGKQYWNGDIDCYEGLCKTWRIHKGGYITGGYVHWDSPTVGIDNNIFKFRIDQAASKEV